MQSIRQHAVFFIGLRVIHDDDPHPDGILPCAVSQLWCLWRQGCREQLVRSAVVCVGEFNDNFGGVSVACGLCYEVGIQALCVHEVNLLACIVAIRREAGSDHGMR